MKLRTVQLQNTLTRKKETLRPLVAGRVGVYACGVTVYDDCHIGHAMQATVFDLLVNFLRFVGYRVTYVRNFTDVDDKIIARAAQLGISPPELVEKIIASCRRDFRQLGLGEPTVEPRVTENMPEIIALIETLVAKDSAYATAQGNVYFRVRAFADYGKLSNRNVDQMQESEPHTDDKHDVLDFALWKAETVEGACWDSPWGKGRPGWHIECSAMAKKHLGVQFDIHGGGQDLVFPHHENEIAQSVCANDSPYATIWMHNGLLTVDGQKMAKSVGNHITIADFLRDWHPEIFRLTVVTHQYRSNVDFSEDIFRANRRRLFYYYQTLQFLHTIASDAAVGEDTEITKVRENFCSALADDLNTPVAIAELHTACKKANELRLKPKSEARDLRAQQWQALVLELGQVLGLLRESPQVFIDALRQDVLQASGLDEETLNGLIAQRTAARQSRDFARADRIRQELRAQGIELRDYPDRTEWLLTM